MKKTLLYHLYANDNFENIGIYRLHYECLTYYIKQFDEAIFYVTVDNLNNKPLVNKLITWVSDICQDVPFDIKVRVNELPYEGKTLMTEIIEKRQQIEGMVFFCHTKGNTRVNVNFEELFQQEMGTIDTKSIIYWVLALYFYGLNFIDEAEYILYGGKRPSELFYGPILTQLKDQTSSPMLRMNKGNCFYQGTFYWINTEKFSNYIDRKVIEIPKLDDRYWAEMLPGVVGGRLKYGDGCASHNDTAINDDFNLYKMSINEWEELINILGNSDEFWNFHDYIMKKVLEKRDN